MAFIYIYTHLYARNTETYQELITDKVLGPNHFRRLRCFTGVRECIHWRLIPGELLEILFQLTLASHNLQTQTKTSIQYNRIQ